MSNRGTGAGRLAAAHLGDGDLANRNFRTRTRLCCGVGGGARRRDLAGERRQIVLNRLEFGDRPPELRAVERVLDRLFENFFERPGHLLQADRGAEADEQILIDHSRPHSLGRSTVE